MLISRAMVLALGLLAYAAPLHAQIPVAVFGRVEDASSHEPVVGAGVFSPDSSSVAVTDSLGEFTVQIDPGEAFAVQVELYGYMTQQFDLGEAAASRLNVLRLRRDPIQLPGVTAVAASAVTELLEDLHHRRNSFKGAVAAFDRAQLERLAPVGSVLDFIHQRYPLLFECGGALCVHGRGRTIENPNPVNQVLVCVDWWTSLSPLTDLSLMDAQSVALIEVYGSGRGGIRVYTPGFLAHAARTGSFMMVPLDWGC